MLREIEDISTTKKRLVIEIPAEEIESEIQKTFKGVQLRTKLPGFRPGKAPMTLIEKKFGKEVEAEVLEKIVPDFYMKAVKEAGIIPVARPVVEKSFDFKRNTPLSMTVTVEVRPRIEPLAYDGFTVKEVSVEVADEEVEALLQTVAEERAVYEPVDGDLQQGDLAIIDYTVPESGDSAKDVVFKVGSGHFPNEFFETLLGKKRDDECDVEASFPEDSPTPFAGKRQRFSVKIKEIKRRNIPVVNDDFAKDLQFEHLEDLKAKLRERVITAKKRDVEATQQSELIEKLIATHSFDAPEALVNQEIGAAIAQIRAMSKDERSDEILKEDIRPKAERNVKAAILLELIGEKEGISISDEEIKEEILSMAQRVNFSPEDIIKYHIARDGSLDRLKQSFLEKKVLQFLLSRTTVEKGA